MGLIRLILVISIFVVHIRNYEGDFLLGATLAVHLFFLISGFFISFVLTEKYKSIKGRVKTFYLTRFLRILPLYWLILFLTLLTIIFFRNYFLSEPQSYFGNILAQFHSISAFPAPAVLYFFLINLTPVFQDTVFYLKIHSLSNNLILSGNALIFVPKVAGFLLVPVAWILALEIYFYLLAPWLLKLKIKPLLVFIILLMLLRIDFILNGLYYDPWNYRFFPLELNIFLLSILSYKMSGKILRFSPNKLIDMVLYITVLIVIINYYSLPQLFIGNFPLIHWIIILLLGSVLPFIFRLFKYNKLDIFLSNFSYILFLSHFLIIDTFRSLYPVSPNHFELIVTVSIILFSLILYIFFLIPLEKFRSKFNIAK